MDSVGEGESGKIWENGTETLVIFKEKAKNKWLVRRIKDILIPLGEVSLFC